MTPTVAVGPTLSSCAAGFLFSAGVGSMVGWAVLKLLRRASGIGDKSTQPIDGVTCVPGWVTGNVERVFFTIFVLADISGTGTAMIGWISAKMVANWNSGERLKLQSDPGEANPQRILSERFAALVAGMVSVMIATIGGLVAKGKLLPLPSLGFGFAGGAILVLLTLFSYRKSSAEVSAAEQAV